MPSSIFVEYVKGKLPRKDDQDLFDELYKVYHEGGKKALQDHLESVISDMEA